jgi:uncharacterized membrane protein
MARMDKNLSRKPGLALLLIILFSSAIRFVGLGEKQLWIDEILQVIHSTPDSMRQILEGVAEDRGSAPLDYIVQHYGMKAAGQRNEISARLHAAFFGSISILFVYFVGLNLFHSRKIALLSSALYGIYPFHHHYSQEGRPYVLFVFLVLVLFALYQKMREQFSWKKAALMGLLAVVSFYTHPYTAMVFAVFVCIELLHSWKLHHPVFQRLFLTIIGSGAVGALAFFPWVVYSFHNARGDSNDWLGWRLVPDVIKAFGDGSYPLAIPLLAFAVLGVIRLKKDKSDSLIDLTCWMLVPFPIIFAILCWRSYFLNTRQLLFITPAIIFCAAYGLSYLLSLYRKLTIPLLAVYICICFAVIGLHFSDTRIDFKGASAYLQQKVRPGDRIFAPGVAGYLSFYFPELGKYEQHHFDRPGPGNTRLFIVDTQYADADNRQKLDELQKESLHAPQLEFRGIKLSVLGPVNK